MAEVITDVSELSGLPNNALGLMSQAASHKKLEGYLVNLEIPTYLAIMTHCDNRECEKSFT